MSSLAMFPLGTVLVPHAVLPLHVFEPRYQALMRDCLAGDHQFGVVLIERGSEVGGNDVRFGVGTVARIDEAAHLPDGRWLLVAHGVHRVRVDGWLPDDPYPRADVSALDDRPWDPADAPALERAVAEVRTALAYASELGEPVAPATFELAADPAMATWQLVSIAPLGPVDKQRLLEFEGHGPRLAALAGLVHQQAEALVFRLGS
jgi:uncharacterized protein